VDESARKQRNSDKLEELYPTFRTRIAAVIAALEGIGIRPRIQEAWRSPSDQLIAWQTGHSKLKYGFHNVTGKNGAKEAFAVDLLDDDHALNPSTAYLLHVAAAAQGQGLTTGLRWGLPPALAGAIDEALTGAKWDAPIKIGWDPTHIEPTGLTPTQARAGTRPEMAT
jgi:hypothetical protein